MIDIHAHIIPGVDDGAADMLDAVLMAELALESGVDTIIATPHANIPWEEEDNRLEIIRSGYQALKEKLAEKKLPLNLFLGMEIFATDDMAEKIQKGELIPLNQTNCYLIEFGFRERGRWCTNRLQEVLELGGIPIIAHAERYECVQHDISLAEKWIDMGCQIQLNKGSMFGKFGREAKKTSLEMLQRDLVSYVASDAHSPYHRTTYMGDAYEYLCDVFSRKKAMKLLLENAKTHLLSSEGI